MKKIIKIFIILISIYIIFVNLPIINSILSNSFDTVTILTINDFHAHIEPFPTEYGQETGGMALISGYVDYFRQGRDDVVWTIAGDHFQGTPIDSLTKGEALIKLLNLDPPDVFCLGNHEFDYGKDILLKRIDEANFPIICANIVYEDTGGYFTTPYIIKDIDGVKTLFIGVICEGLKSIIVKGSADELKVLPAKDTVEKIAKEFINDVDLTVVVSHIGYEADLNLAKNLPKECGVDIIVGGHSHTILNEATVVNGVIIVQAGDLGKFIGKMDLTIDLEKNMIENFKWELIPVIEKENIKPNPDVEKLVNELISSINTEFNKTIGKVVVTSIMPNCELETALGNFSCDVPVKKLGVDIAFQNSGGLRAWIADGDIIKIKNIWEVFPFDNYWVIFKISAKQLWTIIETNTNLEGEHLMIPYTLSYKFDSSKPKGSRVLKIWFKGEKVEPRDDIFFECATCNFIWGHAKECFGLSEEEIIKNGDFKELKGISYRDVYIDYVKEKKTIYLSTEGRVIDVNIKDLPFLFLNLESGMIRSENRLMLEGYTERECKIVVNNEIEVYPDEKGKFYTNIFLSEGKNEIYITSINSLGNKNERKIVVFLDKTSPVIIDTTPPTLNILFPENNIYINKEKIKIEGSILDNLSGVDKVLINYEDVTLDENNEFIKEIVLNEGENKIKIEAIDRAGNKIEKILTVYLDNIPPEILVSLPNEVYDSMLSIDGKIKDDLSGVDKVLINYEDVTLDENNEFIKEIVLNEGENKIKIEATDKAGNKIEKILTVCLDNIPPEILVSLPNEVYDSMLSIDGKIKDDLSGIESLKINGVNVNISSNSSFTYSLSLYEGDNKIKFEAVDKAGKKTTKEITVKYIKRIVLKLQIGNKNMYVNDEQVDIDVSPTIVEGRTYLPIRWVAEPLSAEVEWDGNERKVTITLKGTTIELWIGKNMAKVNGVDTPIDPDNPKVVPIIISGRTMLPVRFVAENLGCKVDWEGVTKTITITYPAF